MMHFSKEISIAALQNAYTELETRHGDLNIKCLQLEATIKELRAEHKELRESMRRNTEAACKRIKELEAELKEEMAEHSATIQMGPP